MDGFPAVASSFSGSQSMSADLRCREKLTAMMGYESGEEWFQKADTFWNNPQFRVRIEEFINDCPHKDAENILVSLMQNHERRHRKSQVNNLFGFYVFEMKSESGKDLNRRKLVAQVFSYSREVMNFFRLNAGEYLIVPCTDDPGETASFVLSVFSKHEAHFEQIKG